MLNLLSQNPAEAGFRFHEAEILNWGTFDAEVYRIAPGGETSLLTGANGSGKTTYIDALLSLLVPEKRMRFYNQSSGAGSRHDRTEESYVLGEYGQTEDDSGKVIQRLRSREQGFFSVLLATFFNQGLQQWISLAQVRWFVGSDLRRSFVIARSRLSIAGQFAQLDSEGHWKRRLKAELGANGSRTKVIQFTDQPGEYARELRKQLGMRSEKAQTLFSQTIGLKVLGNLNDFVRSHMLEEAPAEEEFEQLRSSFYQLLSAHTTLKKLRCQLELLTPLETHYADWLSHGQDLGRTQAWLEALPIYDAIERQGLLEFELLEAAESHAAKRHQRKQLEQRREDLRLEQHDLEAAIRNDATGQQIKTLERVLRELNREKDRRSKESQKYNRLALRVGLSPDPDAERFRRERDGLSARAAELSQQLGLCDEALLSQRVERENRQRELRAHAEELQGLKQRKNNIGGGEARIRAELVQHLEVAESELPFAGELLQVKASESNWELAIEKVLHHFALHLLVPDRLYRQVNSWVNATDLKGRIRYFRLRERGPASEQAFVREMLPGKLEILPDAPCRDWLRQQLAERFAYLCTDDLQLFQRADLALTSRGLIRSREKHEKDDRTHTFDRRNFVLGWENKAKIRHLEQELVRAQQALEQLDKAIRQLEKQQKQLQDQGQALDRLSDDFEDFEALNWPAVAIDIDARLEEKRRLEQANDSIRLLEAKLAEVTGQLKRLETERDTLVKEEDRLQRGRDELEQELQQVQITLSRMEAARRESLRAEFAAGFALEPANGRQQLNQQTQGLKQRLEQQKDQLHRRQSQLVQLIERAMRAYKVPELDLQAQFPDWRADTYTLGEDIGYAEDYLRIAVRIRSQELIEQEKRFQTYFNQSILERMTAFEQFLQRQRENIEDNIQALNRALRQIDFRSNPRTYIQLKPDLLRLGRAAAFREDLRHWKPVAADSDDPEVLEASFLRIKDLIEQLEQRPDWRKEVTDVRNWMEFSAQEFFAEDATLYRKYESTGKLSGGEKAQLTYTILGAAIAYQFNLSQEGTDTQSFRFICVDESFSNQDDEKAGYLMSLCWQLHLQLLVVTPNDKTHVVEPYISRIHLVLRRHDRNSILIDMPIQTFQQQRAGLEPK